MTSPKIITGIRKKLIRLRVGIYMARLVYRQCGRVGRTLRTLQKLARHRKAYAGKKICKVIKVDGKFYWDLYIPGYKTEAISNFFNGEISRTLDGPPAGARFTNVLIATTKQCPLRCEHCFEWEALNHLDNCSLDDVKTIVSKFQRLGTGIVQLTGGEPLTKIDDLLEILRSANSASQFWVLTSGYNLTSGNAQALKNAGLTGAVISLDHYDPVMHNLFRSSGKSFEWACSAVANAIQANLVTALSICVSKAFATREHLIRYAELAKTLGVSFIQLLEPREAGHYKGKDVMLNASQEKILEDFYLRMNFDYRYRKYPIVCYHGYYQRRTGCFGSANRSLYVDTDGDLHACPFCRSKMGSALHDRLEDKISHLAETGCHRYTTSTF